MSNYFLTCVLIHFMLFSRGFFILVLIVLSIHSSATAQRYTVSGYVRESGSAELLIGVYVSVPGLNAGSVTNTYGFYSVTLPASDSLEIIFSSLGYQSVFRKIAFKQNIELNIDLMSDDNSLQEVVVVAERSEKVSDSPQMSTIDIPIQQIKDIPALFGEKDVLKVLQLMPGVQKGSEGNSGIYVRGGGPDQNLLILDDATVYNAFHLFGFFSLFNGDALKSVELIKGGFPARYGGRLSSVIEMNMKDGNKEKLHGQVGIGLLSTRFTLEGPILKKKSSFLISGRRSYIDALIGPFEPKQTKGGYYFYDLNAKLNYDFGRKNKVYLSGYFGKDKFYATDKTDGNDNEYGLHWGNATGTARWNHLFNEKTFANASFIFSNYQFGITEKTNDQGSQFNLDYRSSIRDFGVKYDVEYLPNPRHSIRAGFQSTYHRFTPSAVVIESSDIAEFKNKVTHIDVLESGLYVQDIVKLTEKITMNIGIRMSHFVTVGKTYINPEPRFSGAYKLRKGLALKISYARMNQYLHLLSNTGVGLPTDLWVPSTKNVVPERSQQIAAGIAKDFLEKNFALTIEGYYKKSDQVISYKEGASFLLINSNDPNNANPLSWEQNITRGQGWSYGTEFLLQKKTGKLSGWIGYTLSWTQLQFDSLNFGKKYYARYDRRHDISVVSIYKPNDKITMSMTWVYGTGNAITLPQAQFTAPEQNVNMGTFSDRFVNDYGTKNSFRMAPYHRMDIGIQFHKTMKWGGVRTWEISIYNVYDRKNPYFYYTATETQGTQQRLVLKQISIFPLLPSVSYNLKF
jgi:hypothetical protein